MHPQEPDGPDKADATPTRRRPNETRGDTSGAHGRDMEEPYTGPGDQHGITTHGLKSIGDLRAAKQFAEMIVDTVREGLLILDMDLRVLAANESFYRMFGVTREETEGRLVYELGNGQWDLPELRGLLEDLLPQHKTFDDFEVDHVFEGLGRCVMLLNARQLDDHQMILLAVEDVTGRRTSERELRRIEERHRFFIETAQEYAIFHLDADGRIMSWNPGAERILGYTKEEIIGQPLAVIFPEEARAAGAPEREQAIATREGRATDDRWHVRKDGTRFWASGALEALRDSGGHLRGFTKLLRDNTERKQAQEALQELNEHLEERVEERTQKVRDLASRLTMAEQRERRRISHILHDDLQQLLFGIQMKMMSLRADFEEVGREESLHDLAKAEAWMDEAIETTRKLTVELSPPVLKNEGFSDMLFWLRTQMQELHDLEVYVRAEQPYDIRDEDLRVLLFQSVRELLFNVVKHGEAHRATVEIENTDDDLILRVTDAGRGFDVEEASRRARDGHSFGLFSIRERLELVGGRLDIESTPGEGTSIVMYVPETA